MLFVPQRKQIMYTRYTVKNTSIIVVLFSSTFRSYAVIFPQIVHWYCLVVGIR